jgi:hypothetical protein
MRKLALLWLIIAIVGIAQNPQTQTAPIYQVNAKYTNGVAPGYAPTAGSGLTLNIGPGTANCGSGLIVTYAGGVFSLTASATNRVYLDTTAACTPSIKTGAFSSTDIPIAVIVTGSSAITSITDDRTPFTAPSGSVGPTSGVQYNPDTTAYFFATFSGPYDDNHALSSAVPVSNYSCSAGVCTVNTSVPHNLFPKTLANHNNYVDATILSGFSFANQAPFNGSFPVNSTPTSTQFTFLSSQVVSCSSSCGNIYDASYWGIYQAANQPFLYGHGTVYGAETDLGNLDANFSSEINCSAGSPTYLIIEAGQNDLAGGAVASDLLPHYLSIWSKAHAAGCLVIQGSLVAANYGGIPPSTVWPSLLSLNWQFPVYAKSFSNTSTGQYWDRYIDYNAYMASNGFADGASLGSTSAGAYSFAQLTNHAFSTQSTQITGPFPMYAQGGRNNEIAFGPMDNNWSFYAGGEGGTTAPWMSWSNAGTMTLTQNFGSNGPMLNVFEPFSDICSIVIGHDTGSLNSWNWCFNYTANGSSSNYTWFGPTGSSDISNTDVLRMYSSGILRLPRLTASSGTQPLQVDTFGNVSVGAGSSVSVNGSPVSNPNLNGSTPSAPIGNTNVTFQVSGSNVTAYVPTGGGGGVSSIVPGSNITCTPLSGGTCVGAVTVNSSGGGGGSYQYSALSMPPASSTFTWQNQGSATASTTTGTQPLYFTVDSTGGQSWRLFTTSATLPTAPWAVKEHLRFTGTWQNFTSCAGVDSAGLALFDGTKALLMETFCGSLNGLRVEELTTLTSDNTTVKAINPNYFLNQLSSGLYLAWCVDSGHYYAEASIDGVNWIQFYTQTPTFYLTPTSAGVSMFNQASSLTEFLSVDGYVPPTTVSSCPL